MVTEQTTTTETKQIEAEMVTTERNYNISMKKQIEQSKTQRTRTRKSQIEMKKNENKKTSP
jgi:hypothetical protein